MADLSSDHNRHRSRQIPPRADHRDPYRPLPPHHRELCRLLSMDCSARSPGRGPGQQRRGVSLDAGFFCGDFVGGDG